MVFSWHFGVGGQLLENVLKTIVFSGSQGDKFNPKTWLILTWQQLQVRCVHRAEIGKTSIENKPDQMCDWWNNQFPVKKQQRNHSHLLNSDEVARLKCNHQPFPCCCYCPSPPIWLTESESAPLAAGLVTRYFAMTKLLPKWNLQEAHESPRSFISLLCHQSMS